MIKLTSVQQQHFETLNQDQRELLAASGVFAPSAPFTAHALISVWKREILAEEAAQAHLSVIKSLMPHFFQFEDEKFYQHADSQIHAFALQSLMVEAAADDAHRIHLRYYQNRSETWLLHQAGSPLLEAEVAQYGHAFEWAQMKGYEHLLAYMVAGCQNLTHYRVYHGLIQKWLDTTLNLLEVKGDTWGLPAQIRSLGDIALEVKYLKTARHFYYHALQRWGEAGIAGQAHTFKSLGDLSVAENDWENALGFYVKALVLYEVMNFKLGQANTLKLLGNLHMQLKDLKSAENALQKAIKFYDEMDFEAEKANALKDLGDLLVQRQQFDRAKTHYEQADQLYNKIEFWVEQANVLLAVGRMYALQNDPQAALQRYDRALPMYQEAGERLGQAQTLRAVGDVNLGKPDLAAAARAFQEADTLYQSVGEFDEAAHLRYLLINLYMDLGETRKAMQTLIETIPLMDLMDNILRKHEVRSGLRQISSAMGEEFLPLWNELSHEAILPEWLIPELTTIPPYLVNLLEDAEALYAGLSEEPHEVLRQVNALDVEHRKTWLSQALEIMNPQDSIGYFQQALLLKEWASFPDQDVNGVLHQAIAAFDTALEMSNHSPQDYGRIQNRRVALLRDMAGMRGENRGQLLKLALEGCNLAVEHLKNTSDYPRTQFNRANLLRELAGLKGESRGKWMHMALDAYNEVLELIPEKSLEHATTETNRASLLLEIADLPTEAHTQRLKEALVAAAHAYHITLNGKGEVKNYQRVAERMLSNVRKMIVETFDQKTFDKWWEGEIKAPEPDWLKL